MSTDQSWRALAHCADTRDPERFSPVDHRNRLILVDAELIAREYCGAGCPVLAECFLAAQSFADGVVMAGHFWRRKNAGKPVGFPLLPELASRGAA